MRARAFTLFSRAYDQVRRAVNVLRWDEGDADSIAPSLYAGRGGRGKSAENKPGTGTATGTELPPQAPPSPATPTSDLPAKSTKPAVGAPDSQPFMQE